MFIKNEATRKWIYGIATAVIPLLVLLGYINDEIASSVTNIVAAVLGTTALGLATANTKAEEGQG